VTDDSERVLQKEPCPKCGSKDNLVRYADGHAHCFSPSCGHHEPQRDGAPGGDHHVAHRGDFLGPKGDQAFAPIKPRGLTAQTLKRFGYFKGKAGSKACQVAPYYDQTGTLAHQKLRFAGKDFFVISGEEAGDDLTSCRLFGQQVWGDKFDKRIVIFTGEIDAMTAAQVMNFKTPCVSVNTGDAGAVKCLQANYRWLDRFAEIVLFYDNDESGQKIVEASAKLFAVGKVKVARMSEFKDASEAMQKGRPGDIQEAVYAATTFKPRGIVNAADCIGDFTTDEEDPPAWRWPWEGLNTLTGGIRLGEVEYFVAGTGVGKTSVISEVKNGLLFAQPEGLPAVKIGDMMFEFSRKDNQKLWLSTHMSRRLMVDPAPREEVIKAHKEVFGSRRVEMFDPEEAQWSMEAALGYIRYMAKGLECNVVFIQPLSFLAALLKTNDPVRALDEVSATLARLTKELGIALIVEHHLKRVDGDGHGGGAVTNLNQVRGGEGLAMFASQVHGIERDQQSDDPQARLVSTIRTLKNRVVGPTGPACAVKFNPATGRLKEVPIENKGGFGPVPSDGFGEDF
jgi:twinkle protein